MQCENPLLAHMRLRFRTSAHGSIRMNPVFMALSQSAVIAAGLALDKN
ncbi:MAG: FAD-dependent oxidoreductase [Gemmatimonadaceae bacterium]|nr:FAD-dependent oxidoreductase [Gemmatimonadaceae bacterium]